MNSVKQSLNTLIFSLISLITASGLQAAEAAPAPARLTAAALGLTASEKTTIERAEWAAKDVAAKSAWQNLQKLLVTHATKATWDAWHQQEWDALAHVRPAVQRLPGISAHLEQEYLVAYGELTVDNRTKLAASMNLILPTLLGSNAKNNETVRITQKIIGNIRTLSANRHCQNMARILDNAVKQLITAPAPRASAHERKEQVANDAQRARELADAEMAKKLAADQQRAHEQELQDAALARELEGQLQEETNKKKQVEADEHLARQLAQHGSREQTHRRALGSMRRPQTAHAHQETAEDLARRAFEATNKYRVSKGLPPVQWRQSIADVCLPHSRAMGDGHTAWGHGGYDNRKGKISALSFAENLFMCQNQPGDIAQVAVDSWVKSPGHRKNLEGNFTYCGIGVYKNAAGEWYFTQIFATF